MKPGPIDLSRAVVAITGGGRGIGAATARAFADRGAIVAIGDLDAGAALTVAEEIGARAFALDVGDRESFAAFVEAAENSCGPIDVLVNNAGIMPVGRFLDERDDTAAAIFAVNVHGPILGMKLVLPGMIERRRGHVVNVASYAGKFEIPGLATYCASKHAVVGLTGTVNRELAGTGVTLTAVLPAAVDTELSSGIPMPFERIAKVPPARGRRGDRRQRSRPPARGVRAALDRRLRAAHRARAGRGRGARAPPDPRRSRDHATESRRPRRLQRAARAPGSAGVVTQQARIAVIGAGLSGICVGARLRRAGIEDFVVLESAGDVGGTWRDNTYPGCACDIPSLLYSFSFAPNPDWSRYFAPQGQIQAYARAVAESEGVTPHVRFGAAVRAAEWDEHARAWRIETSAGEFEAQVVVAGAGPWHEPLIPALPGLAGFAGRAFHSSAWDHDHDLRGRRVAVIGTGASAVQFVPEIAPEVEHLTVFQRTPHWVLPKLDRPVTGVERALLARLPGAQRLLRAGVFNLLELLNGAMHRPDTMRRLQRLGELNLRIGVRDPALRAQLTPDWTLGCKRVLMSNDWYPALTRENVTVVPAAVERVGESTVTDARGEHHAVDTIVFGTGFHILDMPIAGVVRGRDGRTLAEVWDGSPRGYLGTTTSGFPNAFLMLGPNIGINTSATVIMEYQAGYVVEALRTMERERIDVLDVRPEAQDAFNAEVDERLRGTVWNEGNCASYFIDRNGRNSFNYPGTARDLGRRLERFELGDYVATATREPALAA